MTTTLYECVRGQQRRIRRNDDTAGLPYQLPWGRKPFTDFPVPDRNVVPEGLSIYERRREERQGDYYRRGEIQS